MAGFSIDSSKIECKANLAESSVLNTSQASTLTNQMRDEIEELIEKKFKTLSGSKVESARGFEHCGVTCDNCRKYIVGNRYKSLFKYDFDLCETCEATGVHPEPLIKIRAPLGIGIGTRLNTHFETMKNLISEKPTRTCPYSQKKEEEKAAPFHGLCHVRRSVVAIPAPVAEPQPVSKAQCPARLGLCHVRTSAPAQAEISEPSSPCGTTKMLQVLSRMFPGVDKSMISKVIDTNKEKDIHDIANIIIDSLTN